MKLHYEIESLSRELKQISVLLEELMLNCRRELTKRLPMLPIRPLNQNTINVIKKSSDHMLDHDQKAVLCTLSIYLDVRYAHSLCLNLSYRNFLLYADMLKRSRNRASNKICKHPNFIRAAQIAETHKDKHPKENFLIGQIQRAKRTDEHPLVVVDNFDFLAHFEKRASRRRFNGITVNPAKQDVCEINNALPPLVSGEVDFVMCGPFAFAGLQETLPEKIIIYFRSRKSMNLLHKYTPPGIKMDVTYIDLDIKSFLGQPMDSAEKAILKKQASQAVPVFA